MNKKGFIAIPVLAWWIIGAIALVGGSVAVKSGLVTVNLSGEQGEVASVTETAKPNIYSPPPAPISTPTPTPKPVQQIAPTIDPDPIINCNFPQNGIKKLKRSECSKSFDCQIGEKWYIYTDKNKCSEDQKNYWSKVYSPSTGNSNLSPSEPLINCVLSYGTFQLRQATCDDFKKSDKPLEPLIDCHLSVGIFQLTQAKCDELKTKDSQVVNDQAQATKDQHNLQVTNCRSGVGSLADYQQRCTQYGGGSAAQACRQITQQEWQTAYNACGTTY